MNIAAAMAVLETRDLDCKAKYAVLVVVCRLQPGGKRRMKIEQIADDMGVGYFAADHALRRAVAKGYLAVDKSPGRVPTWWIGHRFKLGATDVVHTNGSAQDNLRDSVVQPPRSGSSTSAIPEDNLRGVIADNLRGQTADTRIGEDKSLEAITGAALARHPASGARNQDTPTARPEPSCEPVDNPPSEYAKTLDFASLKAQLRGRRVPPKTRKP